MRAKVSKQSRTKRVVASKGKRLRRAAVVGGGGYIEEILSEEPPRMAISIYTEETEIKDHEEEPAA